MTLDHRDRVFTITATLEQLLALTQEELAEAEEDSKSKELLEYLKTSLINASFFAVMGTRTREHTR